MNKKHVITVAKTIWQQIRSVNNVDNIFVIGSWGISEVSPATISLTMKDTAISMAALSMTVNGLLFQGQILIALDEGADYYRIFTVNDGKMIERASEIGWEELIETLDGIIEKDPRVYENSK